MTLLPSIAVAIGRFALLGRSRTQRNVYSRAALPLRPRRLAAMPAGYMIRVTTPPIRNEGSTQELFEVAIEDEDQAKSVVRKLLRRRPTL